MECDPDATKAKTKVSAVFKEPDLPLWSLQCFWILIIFTAQTLETSMSVLGVFSSGHLSYYSDVLSWESQPCEPEDKVVQNL